MQCELCGVLWCAVLWCTVVWCAVVCCGVVCCGVLCCGVLGVLWWSVPSPSMCACTGGGFGGKETRSVPTTVAVALAAKK